jgi:hypothetical protein
MRRQEETARALAEKLRERGIAAKESGAGVHWQVDGEAERKWTIHCFWYERDVHALMLGVNPANARASRRRSAVMPYEGPEYLVKLGADLVGRTREDERAITAVRVWLEGGDLVAAAPFIDDKPRAMRAIAKTLDPRLRWDIEGDPTCSLWIEDDARSVEARRARDDDSVTCRFLHGQQPIATAIDCDVAALSRAWLLDRISIRELSMRDGMEGERHAEILEIDPAKWHWAHVRDRIADPDDVLAPLRPLIETFAESPIASRFFSFSSLYRFCFSASSHYPWIAEGLPIVAPIEEGGYVVDRERHDLAGALAHVENVLRACPVAPFFGSAPDHLKPIFAEKLGTLEVGIEQRKGWRHLLARDKDRVFDVPLHLDIDEAVAATLAFFAS